MILAFYKVDNSLNYERHTFDNIYDNAEKILEKLNKLPKNEWRTYYMGECSRTKMYMDAGDFMEDYNDEILDGGWWCVVIR